MSKDTDAIGEAATAFQESDAMSTIDLVDAAAADESQPLPAVGTSMQVGDGSLVIDDVAPATDVIARSIDSGVQMVAVLADATAPDRVKFDLDLPQDAVLTQWPDGSIAVDVPTETVIFDPADSLRLENEVDTIVGEDLAFDDISEEQWKEIDALAPVEAEIETVMQTMAVIAAPWAVDANGAAVGTSYELDGQTLTQVLDIDETTAFPVVADPSAAFWWKAAKCVGQLGLMALAAAKAATMVVKLVKFISGLKKTSAVAKAWKKLLGSGGTTKAFKKLASSLGELLKKLAKEGYSAMKKHATKTAALAASFTILTQAGDAIASIVGVDQCVDLALGRY